ncbi:MAG: DinB family protein [Chloroflexi bacterium]|nr:DinB family protein [Chloroflexota bacterium]
MTDPIVLDMLERIQWRHVLLMRRSMKSLASIVHAADPDALQTKRDGPEGWTPLEILCHLRDFNAIFHRRARQIVAEHRPVLVPYDHLQLVIDNHYAEQDPYAVIEDMAAERERMAAFYESLTPDQLLRVAIHPEDGDRPLYDFLMQVGHHDNDHLEQITRVLAG